MNNLQNPNPQYQNPHYLNPINSLSDAAIRSLYLQGKNDPLMGLCLEDENNLFKSFCSWRSPPVTIATLICLNICSILVGFYHYPLVTLTCYIIMTQIVMCLVYTHLTKLYLTFHGNATVSIAEITQHEYKDFFNHDEVKITTDYLVIKIFSLCNFFINIYRCVNITKSISCVIVLFLAAQFARLIHFFLLFVWIFTIFTVFSYLSTQSTVLAWWYHTILTFFELEDREIYKNSLTQHHDARDPNQNQIPTQGFMSQGNPQSQFYNSNDNEQSYQNPKYADSIYTNASPLSFDSMANNNGYIGLKKS